MSSSMHPAVRAASENGLRVVRETMEFRRVKALPRRTEVVLHTDLMHELLRLPGSPARLNPLQVWGLQEARLYRGLLAPLPVGRGKTLLSLLIPTVTEALRPLLVVPAGVLKRKTLAQDIPHWSKHFRVHPELRCFSYEKFSRDGAARLLEAYQPDCIILDEAQAARNPQSAVHKRVVRYLETHPGTRIYILTGTLMPRSLRQGYKLAWWALRDRSPLPHAFMDIEDWSDVLDEKTEANPRPMPGGLLKFCRTDETLRQGFERHLQESPGYIFSVDETVRSALRVEQEHVKVPPEVEEGFKTLRKWRLPNGDPIVSGVDMARHAKEMLAGFYYRWVWGDDVPKERRRRWLKARRRWKSFARSICRDGEFGGRHFDTEMQVAKACAEGFLHADMEDKETGRWDDVYKTWREVEPEADPQTEAVWISDYMLDHVEKFLKTPQSLAWIEHDAFLERLRDRGVLCFGGGENAIDDEAKSKNPRSCALSFNAHYRGRNLQGDRSLDAPGYNRNLSLACTGSGERMEQAIGRTHREGQEADEVVWKQILGCVEMWDQFQDALLDAKNVYRDGQGQMQKLIYADVTIETETEIKNKLGPLWVKTIPEDET